MKRRIKRYSICFHISTVKSDWAIIQHEHWAPLPPATPTSRSFIYQDWSCTGKTIGKYKPWLKYDRGRKNFFNRRMKRFRAYVIDVVLQNNLVWTSVLSILFIQFGDILSLHLFLQYLMPLKLNNIFSQWAYSIICCLISSALHQLFAQTPHKFIKPLNVLLLR